MRQPMASPMMRPIGRPHTMAIDEPTAMVAMAALLCCAPTMRTATGDTTDQNTACAAATSRRPATSSANVGAAAEAICPAQNSAITPSRSLVGLIRESATIRGIDSSATAHA